MKWVPYHLIFGSEVPKSILEVVGPGMIGLVLWR